MLKKLLKHESHATGRYMWIMYLVLVLMSLGGFIATRFVGHNLMEIGEKPAEVIILMIVGFLWIGVMIAAGIMTIAMNVYRFYKNLLSDEGYLMFTLPVSVHQLVWSKLLVGILWMFLTTVLIFGGIILGFYNVFVGVGYLEPSISGMIAEMFGYMDLNIPMLAVLVLLGILFASAAGVLEFYCVLAIGYGFTKNKALWSVVIYFAISTGISIISGIINVVSVLVGSETMADSMMTTLSVSQQLALSMLGGIGAYAVLAAIFYVVTVLNLKKRLNLA